MRRFVPLLLVSGLVAGTIAGLGGTALAQTGTPDLAAFCVARIEANSADTKADNVAVLTKMVAAAPAAVSTPMADLLVLVKKKGDKAFESKEGTALLATLEPYIYDNCPGQQLPVTANDYGYQGIPATLPAGVTKIKMTNAAPKEGHMMVMAKLTAAGEAMELDKILALPDKKAVKYIDYKDAAFMQAEPGATGYAPINLTPGKYAYMCFFPQGGKKNGKPHFMLGMEGTVTVS
ncbi:MAG: exported protein of unknown function [Acidimicrobiales bacterium]|nr:exported protein of unknown function [Acidimicrobiales bacterium]